MEVLSMLVRYILAYKLTLTAHSQKTFKIQIMPNNLYLYPYKKMEESGNAGPEFPYSKYCCFQKEKT